MNIFRNYFLHLLRFYIFWMLVFVLFQTVFLIYCFKKLDGVSFGDVLFSYWKAVPLNLSMTSYFAVPVMFFMLVQLFLKRDILYPATRWLNVLLIFISAFTCFSELPLFHEWGIKLNFKALVFLKRPGEVFHTAGFGTVTVILLSVILVSWLGDLLFRKYFLRRIDHQEKTIRTGLLCTVGFIPLLLMMVLGIRGGLKQIPINQSSAYFSQNNVLNLAAVNSVWNIMHSITQNYASSGTNPYMTMSAAEAKKMVNMLHAVPADSTEFFLTTTRPNIVFLILEGVSGDCIAECGGDTIMPNFSRWTNDGVMFTNCYASGTRSEQGMAALFSGFPAQPVNSIIEQQDKFSQLPCIVGSLEKQGYNTAFYFGGQLSYGNIQSYMVYNGVDKLIDQNNLGHLPQGKLGVHDEYMVDVVLDEIGKQKQPFCSSFFTTSTHAPYDLPHPVSKSWNVTEWGDYLQACFYSDSCLNVFMERAKTKPWYKNTLFVAVSDHGHLSHKGRDYWSAEHHHIPMLFFGDVVKPEYRGKRIDKVVQQHDMAATLLAQMQLPYSDFRWSRNLMNKALTREFAYFSVVDGYGYTVPGAQVSYDFAAKRFFVERCANAAQKDSLVKQGQAYLQEMFQEYTDK